jgi:pteridine reductase
MSEMQPAFPPGTTVLVTGAARRIGASIAATLHRAGANVAVHYRSSDSEAQQLVGSLNVARADSARAFCSNLLAEGAPEDLVAAIVAWAGRLDVLVNNASSFYPTPLGSITQDQWEDLVGSNLKAPLFLAQAAQSELRKARGCIVNVIDIHAQRPLRNHAVYGAAKAGLAMLTRSLAKDLAPDVRVNGISPGAILWPEDGMDSETKEHITRQIPLGRQGTPDDIASTVLFLVRDAPYVTGQIIAIDGGRSIGW